FAGVPFSSPLAAGRRRLALLPSPATNLPSSSSNCGHAAGRRGRRGCGGGHGPVLRGGAGGGDGVRARAFYCTYAARAGFRVRSSKSFASRIDDAIIMRRFVCTRQGLPSRKDTLLDASKKRRNRASARAACPAMLQVNRRPSSRWLVSRCVLLHSHPLASSSSSADAAATDAAEPNDSSSAEQDGGAAAAAAALAPGGGVAQGLLDHFRKLQLDNPAFCYAVQIDRSGCIANFIWVDARARSLYRRFGDAVVLDLTCRRNRRAVPFAAFTGMNHHRQAIVFGCALMTDESENSFAWLFETWLAFMGGKKPMSFTIGYSRDVEMAAMKVFGGDVRHRFCRRDIFFICKQKLASLYSEHSTLKDELKECVTELERIDEFESTWRMLLSKYNLFGNEWLQTIYSIRHQWVPAYLKDSFFGEIINAPKLETMFKFFQRSSITTTTLRDIAFQFDKAIARDYQTELQEDFATFSSKPVMKSSHPMEKQASELYTKVMFDLFQDELIESSGFLVQNVESGDISRFEVTQSENANIRYTVLYSEPRASVSCSCHKFEFAGVLCRHALRVLTAIGIPVLPENYILKRWTRNAKNNILSQVPANTKGSLAWRCNDLCRDGIRFAEEGATSEEIYKTAKEALQKAFAEILPQSEAHLK
ncbi:Os11g0244900, partial [Oryza sativa Japonica Group]